MLNYFKRKVLKTIFSKTFIKRIIISIIFNIKSSSSMFFPSFFNIPTLSNITMSINQISNFVNTTNRIIHNLFSFRINKI
nr:MAG TPA: hypothetical protein [Caudoviricetes sp.]